MCSQTRESSLVDELYNLGLSISYDRVLEIENGLCVAECKRFSEEGLVCPPNLATGVFTTSAYDNLDHNPTATTSTESFHGTDISMFQHPSVENKIE